MDEEPEPTPEEKQKYVKELEKFTQDVEEQIKNLCSQFGFDLEKINKAREPFATCPFNSGHRMPVRSLEKHLKKCEWNTLGYTKDCKPLPESAIPTESPSTIKFDMELQYKVLKEAKAKNPELNIGDEEKLIPLTSDRLMSDFTVDERRTLYEYVVAKTIAPDVGQDITDMDKTEKKEENTTILELLQQERNLKRRRAKYKGVHTNKKNHTEILREVVEQQMEMYKEYLSEKYGISVPDDKTSFSNEDKFKKEKQHSYKRSYDEESNTSSKYKNHDDFNDGYRSNKIKLEPKDYDEKYNNKNYRRNYDKDHDSSFEHSSHHKDDYYRNSSKDRSSRHSQRSFDQRESHRRERDDKHHYQVAKRDRSDSRYESEDKYSDSRSRKRSRSRSKEKKRDDKRKRSRSYERKNEEKSSSKKRSRSREKVTIKKERDVSSERKSHKKHKKEHKKKRDRSGDRSHKHSKHEHKRRSRSWS